VAGESRASQPEAPIPTHRALCLALFTIIAFFVSLANAEPSWVNVSDKTVNDAEASGKKLPWPGGTAGVVCDPLNGDVYMVLAGGGLWKSSDHGQSFARVGAGAVGGRCETSFALNMDPAGGRLACFMLDGKCAITPDGGKTWQPMADLGRNWDYAAVDWSEKSVANILGERHEVGGEVYLSTDGGRNWKLLFKDKAFDRVGGLGIFDAKTLVRTWPGHGIERSTDAGATWTKVSELQPNGRVAKVNKQIAYWLCLDGLLASKDKGLTWEKLGEQCPGSIGPMFDCNNDEHLAIAGSEGIFVTKDRGRSWTRVAPLPAKFDVPKTGGWFTNIGWDPTANLFYASRMGQPTFRLEMQRVPTSAPRPSH
jgi:photosystem II stability/assembly factor-like uncharacterized protein